METSERPSHLTLVSTNAMPTSPLYEGTVDVEAVVRAKAFDAQQRISGTPFVSRATWELAKTGNKVGMGMLRAQQATIFQK